MKLMAALHGALILGWLGCVLVLSLGVATLGNEEAVLSRERGVGLRERRVLIERTEQLRQQLLAEARRDTLELAVRDLGLPLEAGDAPREQRSSEATLELASFRRDVVHQ